MTFPTVRPARPAYPPPIPSGFIDPGGKTPVEKALRTQAAVHKIYSDWRAAHSKDIDPDVLKRNAGAFSVSDAALALPEAVRAVLDDSDAASQKVNALIKGSGSVMTWRLRLRRNASGHGPRALLTASRTHRNWLRRSRI